MKNKNVWLSAIVALTASGRQLRFKWLKFNRSKNTSITSEIAENQNFVSVIAPYKQVGEKNELKISYSVDLNKL